MFSSDVTFRHSIQVHLCSLEDRCYNLVGTGIRQCDYYSIDNVTFLFFAKHAVGEWDISNIMSSVDILSLLVVDFANGVESMKETWILS